MKKLLTGLAASLFAFAAQAVEIGKAAPEFSLTDTKGQMVTLSGYKGKTVVLEWLNHGCPFVKKHYDSGNMQNLQKEAAGNGVVWISVISSAPGKQGHVSDKQANAEAAEKHAAPAHILRDESGVIGKAYGAKTTPHLFIVNAEGTLVYQGAIDDKPGIDKAEIEGATNYVTQALAELKEGKPVSTAVTTAYGCSVKYN